MLFFDTKKIPGCEYIGDDDGMDIITYNGTVYAVTGWNGEQHEATEFSGTASAYRDRRSGLLKAILHGKPVYECFIRPIYRYEVDGMDLDELEEDSEEWKNAVEVLDIDIDRDRPYKEPRKWF